MLLFIFIVNVIVRLQLFCTEIVQVKAYAVAPRKQNRLFGRNSRMFFFVVDPLLVFSKRLHFENTEFSIIIEVKQCRASGQSRSKLSVFKLMVTPKLFELLSLNWLRHNFKFLPLQYYHHRTYHS